MTRMEQLVKEQRSYKGLMRYAGNIIKGISEKHLRGEELTIAEVQEYAKQTDLMIHYKNEYNKVTEEIFNLREGA